MAPLAQYAHPLVLTALGAIAALSSQYGRDGLIGMWQIHPTLSGDGWTKVRLWVGTPALPVNDPGLGGDMPDVQAYDEAGQKLTEVEKLPWKVGAGAHRDYYLKPIGRSSLTSFGEGPYKRPEYLRISHWGDDPVCISSIGIQMPPDGREVHIMGDMMHKCGWKTYDSAWSWRLGGTDHRPRCFWLGGKGSEFPNNVWLHIPDFDGEATAKLYDESPQRLCMSEPRLHGLDGGYQWFWPIVFWPPMTYADQPDGTVGDTGENATQHDPERVFNHKNWRWVEGKDLTEVTLQEELFKQTRPWEWPKHRRRGDGARAPTQIAPEFYARWADEWSHSNSTEERYSAAHKCQSENTVGPDWANSHERKYCVMQTRELLPYCDSANQSACFDFDAATLRPRRRRPAPLPSASPRLALMGGRNATNSNTNSTTENITAIIAKSIKHEF